METLDVAVCVPHTSTRIHRTETMLARQLAQQGHRVRLVVFELAEAPNAPRGRMTADGLEFQILRSARLAESIYLPMERAQGKFLPRPDVLHVTEDTQTITYWADRYGSRRGVPLCVTTNRDSLPGTAPRRSLYRDAERLFGRRVREHCQAFSVHTSGQLEYLRGRGLKRSDVFVIPNMVDTSIFAPSEVSGQETVVKFPGASLSFLSIGRLVKNKGYAGLLRGFAEVAQQRPDARLTIIGQGPEESALRSLAQSLAISDKIFLCTDFIENPRLARIYPQFHAYLQTSLVEPFGIAVLEAMACGLPVIASRIGGLQHSTIDGQTGILVPPGDTRALASAMLSMADEGTRRRWGAAARERAVSTYDWRKVCGAYIDFYRAGLSKPGPWRLAVSPRTPAAESPARPLRVAIGVAMLGLGPGRSEIALSRYLQSRGHRPAVVTCRIEGRPAAGPGWHEVQGVPVLILPAMRLGEGILLPAGGTRMLPSELIDLFHVTEDSQGVTWWAWRASRKAKRPLAISTERYDSPGTFKGRLAYLAAEIVFARKARRRADALAVRSEAVLRWLQRRRGFQPRNISKIPNGVDAGVFRPRAQRSPLPGIEGDPSILSVGRLVENKDYATLLEAFARVHEQLPRSSLTILGRGPQEAALRERARALAIDSACHFVTQLVPDEDFPAVYGGFGLYAQPSRVEPMALSSLEAMASGLPLVASAVGGMTEVVEEGVNGFLHAPGDAAGLAAALVKAAAPMERARLAKGAREVVERRFDWKVVGAQWLQFYENALRAAPGKGRASAPTAPEWSLS